MLFIIYKTCNNSLKKRSLKIILQELFGFSKTQINTIRIHFSKNINLKNKVINKSQINICTAMQLKIPFIKTINLNQISNIYKNIFEKNFISQYNFIIINNIYNNYITIIISDILPEYILRFIKIFFKQNIYFKITSLKNIKYFINKIFSLSIEDSKNLVSNNYPRYQDETSSKIYNINSLQKNSPIIHIVNTIINQALLKRASDIHIEPLRNNISIRMRIDGVLQEFIKIPKDLHASIISRIKIMSSLNIAEKRLPQDGRTSIFINKGKRDIRVSTVPSNNGERMVLRLLKSSYDLKNVNQLGLSGENLNKLTKILQSAFGIILVTGPTGSGKTTTLYACLAHINKPDINIMTIEDPIEYTLHGISQIQVNPKIKLTFASGLRSFLRQDPDVLMIGEIRDYETAQIAINASLTGHLVFSTIHTNNSLGTLMRLMHMGIEPFLIGNSILAIVTQRLVRMICTSCKEEYKPSIKEIYWLQSKNLNYSKNNILWRGAGCQKCHATGYYGRIGIFEIVTINKKIKNIAFNNNESIQKYIINSKNKFLLDDGIQKIYSGITTISEIRRIIKE